MSWWHSLGLPGTAIDKASVRFPFELELLPDRLWTKVILNNFSLADEKITCWTYLSKGLKAVGQKELIISIKKEPEQGIQDFPQAPFEFLKTVLQHSLRREFLDVGSVSEFGGKGFLSHDFVGAAYLRSQALGDWFPPGDTLATVLLTQSELTAAQLAGLTRVMALLAKSSLHFPCPVWNQLSRKTVVSPEMLSTMAESFITAMPRLLIRDSGVSSDGSLIDLQLPLSSRHYFKQLLDLDPESPLLLLVDFDERSDAVLVFQQEKDQPPLAVSAPGTQGKRIAGSFLCLAPAQNTDHGMFIEDGFALSLRQSSWDELRASLINGSPFYLPRQEEGCDFRLSFHQDEATACSANTIQISGIDPECRSGVSKVENSSPETAVPAFAGTISMLTQEAEVRRLLKPDVLKRYILHIEDVVRDHFLCAGQTDGFLLNLTCCILPGGTAKFEPKSSPIMEADDERDLLDRLAITYAPHINEGTIEFQIEFVVWGGAAKGDQP